MKIALMMYLAFLIVYIWLQFFTLECEKRFGLMLFLLFGQGVSGLSVFGFLQTQTNGLLSILFRSFIIILSILCLLIGTIKLFGFSFLISRTPKYITSQIIDVGVDFEKISIQTNDNVNLSGFHINAGKKTVIIMLHGGFQCKNSFETIGIAQWLSYDFDIISIDTRGHYESGGYWTGDGKTKFDLLATIEYAKSYDYEKIGVFGRSLGGWTAMLLASEIQSIDSLVVVSAPLGHIRATPMVRAMENLKHPAGRVIVRAVHGLRYRDYNDAETQTPLEIAPQINSPIFLIYSMLDHTIGVSEDEVRALLEGIQRKKKIYVFNEVGHLPNAKHLGPIYMMSRDWFLETLE